MGLIVEEVSSSLLLLLLPRPSEIIEVFLLSLLLPLLMFLFLSVFVRSKFLSLTFYYDIMSNEVFSKRPVLAPLIQNNGAELGYFISICRYQLFRLKIDLFSKNYYERLKHRFWLVPSQYLIYVHKIFCSVESVL